MFPHQIVIPFRDRGLDPLRAANLERVLEHWAGFNVTVVDDGRSEGLFNRSAAYNRAAKQTDADVLVFTESDMLIDHKQIADGVALAAAEPGLVVPFTEYRYLTPSDSERVRLHVLDPSECVPEAVMDGGTSIGAVNIVSRETLGLVGQWDETFEGSWFDDRAMCRAFQICCQPTRYIEGPAHHLFHQPGWAGNHLTSRDTEATKRNRARWKLYQRAKTPTQIRALTAGGT